MEFAAAVSLVRKHLKMSCFILLLFVPPVFRTLLFFTPLLVSTALCVLALVSLGPHLAINENRTKKEKIDHLREQGVCFPCEDWHFGNEAENKSLASTDDIKRVSMAIKFECDSEELESQAESNLEIEDVKDCKELESITQTHLDVEDCETPLYQTVIPDNEQECLENVTNADQKSGSAVQGGDDEYSQPSPTCSLENRLAPNYDKPSGDQKRMIRTECQNTDTLYSTITAEGLLMLNASEGNCNLLAVQQSEEICKDVSGEVMESSQQNHYSCTDPSSERIARTSEVEDKDSTYSSSCMPEALQQEQNSPVLPRLQEDRCAINNNIAVRSTQTDVLSTKNNASNRDPIVEKQKSVDRKPEPPYRAEQAPDEVRINGREQHSEQATTQEDSCSGEATAVSEVLPFGEFSVLQDGDVACLQEWVRGYQSALDPWESSLWVVGNRDSMLMQEEPSTVSV
eukprot:c22170_g1_i1 orf=634-2004(+)